MEQLEAVTKKCLQCGWKEDLVVFSSSNNVICRECLQKLNSDKKRFYQIRFYLKGNSSCIVQNIFIGDYDSAMNPETFQCHDITAVCVCANLLTPFIQQYSYKKYKIGDFQNQQILPLFEQNYLWMKLQHNQSKKVLVHCAAGVSRSASFVIAYLMKDRRLTFLQAFYYVKSKRPFIDPNPGFIQQLKKYQLQLFPDIMTEQTIANK